jgi:polyadenylate-binding protein
MTRLTIFRVDDDAALRSKVDEALAVYDDYMKTKTKEGSNGTKEDEAAEAGA